MALPSQPGGGLKGPAGPRTLAIHFRTIIPDPQVPDLGSNQNSPGRPHFIPIMTIAGPETLFMGEPSGPLGPIHTSAKQDAPEAPRLRLQAPFSC